MEIKKMKLGIDIDDTIWKYHEKFFEYYNNKYGTSHVIEQYNDYNLEHFLKITKEEAFDLFVEFEQTSFFEDLILVDNFLESFVELDEKFEIYFITARSEKFKEVILKRLSEILGREIPVYFTKDTEGKKIKEKVDCCLDLGVDLMIDDGLHHLERCAEKGLDCILLDYPWNKTDNDVERIVRAQNWKEIMKKIEERNNGK